MPRNRNITPAEFKAHDKNMARLFPETYGAAARFCRPALSDEQRWELANERSLAGEMVAPERYTHYSTDAAW